MDKSFVTMEQALCPVCGKTHDTGNLLLDKRMRNKFEMHTTTGYGLCEECEKKNKAGFIALIVIDPEMSKTAGETIKMEDAHRTGKLLHMRRDVAENVFKGIDVNRPFVFIDIEMGKKLEAMVKPKGKKK